VRDGTRGGLARFTLRIIGGAEASLDMNPEATSRGWLECRPRGHERRSLASTDSQVVAFS